jgi:8-amino-7-oxononanoate synthase
MQHILDFLKEKEKSSLLRTLNPISNRQKSVISINGKQYLDFSSNDYLGFAENKHIIRAHKNNLKTITNFGSTGSRLITGDYKLMHTLESKIAQLKQKPKALIFNSGYQANIGIISSIMGQKDAIFADKLVHASIIDGCKLSQAKLFRFSHNNETHLQELLTNHRKKYNQALIITESVFSMDGDLAPIKELSKIKKEHNCLLMVDEAHATGLFGKNGAGLVNELNCSDQVDIIMGTFSKALGGFGAYVASSELIYKYLINTARSFIYSTALPLPIIAWNIASLEQLKKNHEKLASKVHSNAKLLNNALKKLGLHTPSKSQIVPIILGTNENTINTAKQLKQHGLWVTPIRYPTVPKNKARIRISINYNHRKKDIENLINKLANENKNRVY